MIEREKKKKDSQEPSGQHQKSNIHYLGVPEEKEEKVDAERKCI